MRWREMGVDQDPSAGMANGGPDASRPELTSALANGLLPRLTSNGSLPDSKSNGTAMQPDTKIGNSLLQSTSKPKPGGLVQLIRFALLNVYWWSCVFSIAISQYLGAPLYLINKRYYYAYMEYTKQTMALLILSLTDWWAPSVVAVSGDESMRGQIRQLPDGGLEVDFAQRLVLISNHHLYNDWLYLWWTGYTNRIRSHGSIYIILKNQIKYVPIIGTGLRLAGFVFMSRNMATDGPRLSRRMSQLTRSKPRSSQTPEHAPATEFNPMWLMMFPEGTNLGFNGRTKSAAWAKRQGRADLKHCLIPRSTGTYFCLKALGSTVEWVYDCTLAYDGIPPGKWGQEVFTLRSCYIEGRPPVAHMYWRRFRLSSIPLDKPEAFDAWLSERWGEKDELLEMHALTGRFPATGDERVVTSVKLRSWWEVAGIFGVIAPALITVGWWKGYI